MMLEIEGSWELTSQPARLSLVSELYTQGETLAQKKSVEEDT